MKTTTLSSLLALLSLLGGIVQAAPLGTAFTYQGRLSDGTNLANGIYDLRFAIHADANAGLQANAVTTDKIADGTLAAADLSPALASNTFWRLDGNPGTSPAAQFLGTTDHQALELRVNARRILRLEPDPGDDAPNLIAGNSSNTVAPGVVGAVIAGVGRGIQPNRVLGAWGVISGLPTRVRTINAE